MKKYTLLFLLCFFSFAINGLKAQSNSYISLVYGNSVGGLNYKHIIGAKCTCSHDLVNDNTFGIRFGSTFNNGKIKYETGIDFMNGYIVIESQIPGEYSKSQKDILVISTPFYIRHEFLNYFFFNYGAMFDYQKYGNDEKYGVGIGFGIGAKYEFEKFILSVNPKIEKHLFMLDELGLIEIEIMLGISYKL